jgi:hypothetical protein
MRKKSKLTKLWEWISHADLPGSIPTKASLSYPDDAQQDGTTLIPVISKSYKAETIIIDGRNFINCEFSGCTIQWNGNEFIFTSCIFDGAQKLVSTVPQVAGTMKLANVCGLLNEKTSSTEIDTGRKVNR